MKLEAEGSHHGTIIEQGADLMEEDVDNPDESRVQKSSQSRALKREHAPLALTRSDSTSTASGPTAWRSRKESNEWEKESPSSLTPGGPGKRMPNHRTVSFSEDGRSSNNRSPIQHHNETHKVPYFRYFGPTAIVPGLKQMVVNVQQHYSRRRSRGGSMSAVSPFSFSSSHHSVPSHAETVLEPLDDLPIYDPNDSASVSPMIIELVKTFFTHLGCSHPFLHEEKVLRLVKEKKLESILVDAMCALASRFAGPDVLPGAGEGSRSEYGNIFAQRAKAAIVDTFPCPSVGSVQAYLLMAYEGFGANQDSALWMYLGLAIRMALDMGLHRTEGVQYLGDKDPWYTRSWNSAGANEEDSGSPGVEDKKLDPKEQQEIVQERTETAWAVYILDRVISTGTGRTVTVRDDEFELPIPEPRIDQTTGLPAPYPIFIHIIQLYGRVSDVLNKIRRVEDLTADKLASLSKIECELTGLHQKQDPRLHFNPLHFQNYVKKGQGTLFILLHVWFHACIIIIHQPLLTPFGSRRHQLTPTSRELAMSSAKTIADILAFAEVIDPMAYIGSPFTSQPMYIAACAFLTEQAANASQPVSRAASPAPGRQHGSAAPNGHNGKSGAEKTSKHSLLADAANQNYQRCYKSLQQLHDYWGGVKYILNALDHRSKGLWDCETYTQEEYASIKLPRRPALPSFSRPDSSTSPQNSVRPIVLSLTGTTNSPKSSLGLLFPNKNAGSSQAATSAPPPPPTAPVSAPTPPGNMIFDPVRQSLPESNLPFSPSFPQPNVSAVRFSMDPSNVSRMSSSMPSSVAPDSRNGPALSQGEMNQATPGTDSRLQILSGLASNNSILPSLHPQPYTPTSNYEPSILQGGSPSSSLADPQNTQTSQQRAHQLNAATPIDMVGSYGHDFASSGLASGSYSYGTIDNAIMVQQIDLGSMSLPDDMVGPWDLFPSGNFVDLFDPANIGDAGGQGQM